MHPLRLIAIFRLICHLLFSNNVKFLKLGFSEYDEKLCFLIFEPEELRNNQIFLWGYFLGTLDTYTKKNKPTLGSFRNSFRNTYECIITVGVVFAVHSTTDVKDL